jgi:peroxiredoxin
MVVPKLDGGSITLGQPENGHDWQLVVVYRGKHCPMCTTYLKEMNGLLSAFHAAGVDAISADPKEKAKAQMEQINPNFTVGYDLGGE